MSVDAKARLREIVESYLEKDSGTAARVTAEDGCQDWRRDQDQRPEGKR